MDHPQLRRFGLSDPPVSEEATQRVLVVASESSTRSNLGRICMADGYEVVEAGPDVLLRRTPPATDLVLLVLEEPETILELLGELRTNEVLVRVGVLALDPEEARPGLAAACMLAGADDYCSLKPNWLVELRARLRVHMRNKRYREAIERLRTERNDLRDRVATDSLTGALARSTLVQFMDRQLKLEVAFAVLFADIDNFKTVNDTYGHQMGDWVLRRVAETLAMGRRSGDACGRFGGEEFVLVLPQVGPEQALRVAERHRAAVSRLRFADDGGPEKVTISIGVAVYRPEMPDGSVDALLRRADTALYSAKKAGRDCVVMAEPCKEADLPAARDVGAA